MADIRQAIDAIDHGVIQAFARRYDYVLAAAKFKTDRRSVRAPERFESMLRQRRQWAETHGLDPDVIEDLYRRLVNHFIELELREWQASKRG